MLTADDISVGQHITVREWLNVEDYSYLGDVLLIKAINLPFIVVDVLRTGGNGQVFMTTKIDTRQVDLIKLSDDYVKNLIFGTSIISAPNVEKVLK